MQNWLNKNVFAPVRVAIFNRRTPKTEANVMTSNNSLMTEMLDIISADAGLITSTGKTKLEETHGLQVFEEMARDTQIKAALAVKKYAVLAGQWEVRPYDDTPAAKEQADFIKDNFRQLLGDRGLGLEPVVSAFAYGRSICEKIYAPVQVGKWVGKVMLKRLAPKNPGYIQFIQTEFGTVTGVRSTNSLGVTVTVPMEKVVHYAWDSEFDNPYGRSDLASCYQWFWAKKTIYKFWMIYADKFASPIPLVEQERGLSAEQDAALATAMANYHTSNFLKLPKGVTVTLAQASGTGGAFYIQSINQCNAEMARAILAQSLTINENQKTGTQAQANVHKDTLQHILDKVQNDIEKNVVLEQLIKPLIDMNFGAQEGYPKFQFATYDIDFLERLSNVMEKLCTVADANTNHIVEPTEPWIREMLNLPKRDEKEYPLRTEPLEVEVANKMPKPVVAPAGAPAKKETPNAKPSK